VGASSRIVHLLVPAATLATQTPAFGRRHDPRERHE
jgi:hypothetical protein